MKAPSQHTQFPDSRWSLVIDARRREGQHSQKALAELCKSYWYPLYCYIRGKGLSPQDAEDRIQAFFANIVTGRVLETVSPEHGRLRAFFKVALLNLTNSQWRHDYAEKRGGGRAHVSIDCDWAESLIGIEPEVDLLENFDRQWAIAFLKNVFARLEAHYESAGMIELYEATKGCLQGDGTYEAGEAIAERLGMSQDTVRSSVFKLRKRFREYVQEEIAGTCSSEEESKAESADLCRILSEQ